MDHTQRISKTPLSETANQTTNAMCADGQGCGCNPERRVPRWIQWTRENQSRDKSLDSGRPA